MGMSLRGDVTRWVDTSDFLTQKEKNLGPLGLTLPGMDTPWVALPWVDPVRRELRGLTFRGLHSRGLTPCDEYSVG